MTGAKVSLFENAFAKVPSGEALLSEVLDDIKSERHAAQIAALRRLSGKVLSYKQSHPTATTETDPELKALEKAAKNSKQQLLAFTMSGTCGVRKGKALQSHSGVLQVDIDDLEQIEPMRSRLMKDPHVAFGFVSPSGRGLKLGLRIDGNHHAASFLAAESYFATTYKAGIDPSVKDLLRLCFVSHDPELWQNHEAKILPVGLQS